VSWYGGIIWVRSAEAYPGMWALTSGPLTHADHSRNSLCLLILRDEYGVRSPLFDPFVSRIWTLNVQPGHGRVEKTVRGPGRRKGARRGHRILCTHLRPLPAQPALLDKRAMPQESVIGQYRGWLFWWWLSGYMSSTTPSVIGPRDETEQTLTLFLRTARQKEAQMTRADPLL
jgi:hypothetical protein